MYLIVLIVKHMKDYHWGIPSSDGIPYGLADFFYFILFYFFFFSFRRQNMPFPEDKQNEGNLVLTWYFRKTFL